MLTQETFEAAEEGLDFTPRAVPDSRRGGEPPSEAYLRVLEKSQDLPFRLFAIWSEIDSHNELNDAILATSKDISPGGKKLLAQNWGEVRFASVDFRDMAHAHYYWAEMSGVPRNVLPLALTVTELDRCFSARDWPGLVQALRGLSNYYEMDPKKMLLHWVRAVFLIWEGDTQPAARPKAAKYRPKPKASRKPKAKPKTSKRPASSAPKKSARPKASRKPKTSAKGANRRDPYLEGLSGKSSAKPKSLARPKASKRPKTSTRPKSSRRR